MKKENHDHKILAGKRASAGLFMKENLGERLFELRKASRLTQQALARKIRTQQSNISRLENGKWNVSVGILQKVADALGCELKIILKCRP